VDAAAEAAAKKEAAATTLQKAARRRAAKAEAAPEEEVDAVAEAAEAAAVKLPSSVVDCDTASFDNTECQQAHLRTALLDALYNIIKGKESALETTVLEYATRVQVFLAHLFFYDDNMLEKRAKEENYAAGQTNGKEGTISKVITNILKFSRKEFQTSFIQSNPHDWQTFTTECFNGCRVKKQSYYPNWSYLPSITKRIELLTSAPTFNYTSDTQNVGDIYKKHNAAVIQVAEAAAAKAAAAKAAAAKNETALKAKKTRAVATMIATAVAIVAATRKYKGTGGRHSSRKTAKSRKGGMHKKTSNKRIRHNITKTNFKKRWG
jgi:hypothetical protein